MGSVFVLVAAACGSSDEAADREIQIGVTNTAGIAAFSDPSTGEEVRIFVETIDGEPLLDSEVVFVQGDDYNAFFVRHPTDDVGIGARFFSHNSDHPMVVDPDEPYVRRVEPEEIEPLFGYMDDLGKRPSKTYLETITDTELRSRSTSVAFAGVTMILIMWAGAVYLGYTGARGLTRFVAGRLIGMVTGDDIQIPELPDPNELRWDIYEIYDPALRGTTFKWDASQPPTIQITDINTSSQPISVDWEVSDRTTYPPINGLEEGSVWLTDATVLLGESDDPDLTVFYRWLNPDGTVLQDWTPSIASGAEINAPDRDVVFEAYVVDEVRNRSGIVRLEVSDTTTTGALPNEPIEPGGAAAGNSEYGCDYPDLTPEERANCGEHTYDVRADTDCDGVEDGYTGLWRFTFSKGSLVPFALGGAFDNSLDDSTVVAIGANHYEITNRVSLPGTGVEVQLGEVLDMVEVLEVNFSMSGFTLDLRASRSVNGVPLPFLPQFRCMPASSVSGTLNQLGAIVAPDPYGCDHPDLTPEERANCGEHQYTWTSVFDCGPGGSNSGIIPMTFEAGVYQDQFSLAQVPRGDGDGLVDVEVHELTLSRVGPNEHLFVLRWTATTGPDDPYRAGELTELRTVRRFLFSESGFQMHGEYWQDYGDDIDNGSCSGWVRTWVLAED